MGVTKTGNTAAPQTTTGRQTLSRIERLRSSPQFIMVLRRGKCFRSQTVRIHYLPTDRGRSRLGLVVSRKVGNSVVRSRVKRRLRHVFRQNKDRFPQSMDVVLVASSRHGEGSFDEYEAALRRFLECADPRQ